MISYQESKKNESLRLRGKWENAVGKQLDSVPKQTHEVSVMIEHLETDAIRDKKKTIVLSCTKSADTD